jgi:hypothetical protein
MPAGRMLAWSLRLIAGVRRISVIAAVAGKEEATCCMAE